MTDNKQNAALLEHNTAEQREVRKICNEILHLRSKRHKSGSTDVLVKRRWNTKESTSLRTSTPAGLFHLISIKLCRKPAGRKEPCIALLN